MKDMINKIPNWLKYTIPPFIIFVIVLLAYYPGILVSDSMVQWHQAQTGLFTDWHPAYNTIYIYLLTRIWNNPFFVLLVQCFILSASFGVCMARLEQYYKINKIYLYIWTIIFGLIPLNFNSAVILLKDTLYSSFILFLASRFIIIINDKEYLDKKINLVKIGLIMLIISLFRHNGILVVLLSFIILIILNYKKLKIYLLCLITLIIYFLLTTVGFSILHIEGGNVANTYGPLSHFAAKLLNENEAYFTDKEIEELSLYVDVQVLKETFNQYNMDNSINAQKLEYIKEHKMDYLKFILKKALEYPSSFIKYYLKLDSFLYSVVPFDGQYTVGMFYETDLWVYDEEYPFLREHSKIPSLLEPLKKITIKYQEGDLGTITMRPALYMYLGIIMVILLSVWLKQKVFIIVLPAIFNIMSLMISIPVAMTRYVYSMMLVFDVIIVLFIWQLYKKIKEKIKND